MQTKILMPIVIMALLLTAWSPVPFDLNAAEDLTAQAGVTNLNLIVNNKTGESFYLVLNGPANYNWSIQPGKQTFSILPGKYKYTYKACGGTPKNGTVVVKKNNHTLVLAVCRQQKTVADATVNVQIQNKTGGYITINLTGPATYRFNQPPGKSKIAVIKGQYSYTAWGCGGANITGKMKLGAGRVWTFWCP